VSPASASTMEKRIVNNSAARPPRERSATAPSRRTVPPAT
jgi:hypothetical protein